MYGQVRDTRDADEEVARSTKERERPTNIPQHLEDHEERLIKQSKELLDLTQRMIVVEEILGLVPPLRT